MSDLLGLVPDTLSSSVPGPVRSMRRWRILHEVANHFDVTIDNLRGQRRERSLVTARHCAFWLIRRLGYSFSQIGKFMDKDHSSVMHGVDRAAEHYRDDLTTLLQRIEGWDTNNDQ